MLALLEDLDELQASVLRTLSSPTRLRLIHLLASGPCEVHELVDALGLSQAATSQHLAALRAAGIVEATRDGRAVEYRLVDADLARACELLRNVLVRRLAHLGDLAATAEELAVTRAYRMPGPG